MAPRESFSWLLLSFITMLYWLGPQSVRLLYAIRLTEFGASDFMVGLIVGGSTLVSLLLAVPSGYIFDGLNGRRALFIAASALTAVTIAFAWAPSAMWIGVLMLLQSVLSMWVWLALQTNITYVSGRPFAARHLNLFSLGWGVGMAIGPAVVAWIYDGWGFEQMTVVCFALTLLGTLLVPLTPNVNAVRRSYQEDGQDQPEERLSFWASLRLSLQDPVIVPVMVCSFVNLYVFSLRTSFYPVFLERMGLTLSTVGMLLSVIGTASLAIRVVLPWGVQRFGNVRLLIWSTWITIIGMVLVPVSPHAAIQLGAAVMIGIGLGSSPAISVNILAASREAAPGVAMGLRMLANRTGQVAQPLVFGGLAGLIGLAWAFPASGILLALTTGWVSWRLRRVDGRE